MNNNLLNASPLKRPCLQLRSREIDVFLEAGCFVV